MRIFLVLLSSFLMISCKYANMPPKVKDIPPAAFWVGGADGGKWFFIEKSDTTTRIFHFKIYNDHSGALEVEKDFKLQCENKSKIRWEDIGDLVVAFDGTRIYLGITEKTGTSCYFE